MESTALLWQLRKLSLALEQYARTLSCGDLTPAQSLFLYCLLVDNRSGFCASELHVSLGLSKATLSSLLRELERKGYLTTQPDPHDDRKKRLSLTESAHARAPELEGMMRDWEESLYCGLDETRRRRLAADLELLLHNVRQEITRRTETT